MDVRTKGKAVTLLELFYDLVFVFAISRLTGLLEQLGFRNALEADFAQVHDAIVLGSANSIAEILAYSGNIFGIETMLPASGYVHVLPKTLLGCTGALFLLEQVLNGTRLLNAWN